MGFGLPFLPVMSLAVQLHVASGFAVVAELQVLPLARRLGLVTLSTARSLETPANVALVLLANRVGGGIAIQINGSCLVSTTSKPTGPIELQETGFDFVEPFPRHDEDAHPRRSLPSRTTQHLEIIEAVVWVHTDDEGTEIGRAHV